MRHNQALFNDINEGDESSDTSCSNLQLNSSYQQSTTNSGAKTATTKQATRAPSNESSASSDSATVANTATNGTSTQEKKPFQSRFLNQPLTVEPPKKQETESSSDEDTSEEDTESEEESEEESKPTTPAASSTTTSRASTISKPDPKPETSSYRTRSNQVQEEARSDSRKNSREEPRSTYGQAASNSYKSSPTHSSFERDESPKYGRVRSSATTAAVPEPEPESRYGSR